MSIRIILGSSDKTYPISDYWILEKDVTDSSGIFETPVIDSTGNIYFVWSNVTTSEKSLTKLNPYGVIQFVKKNSIIRDIAISNTDRIYTHQLGNAQFGSFNTSGVIQNQTAYTAIRDHRMIGVFNNDTRVVVGAYISSAWPGYYSVQSTGTPITGTTKALTHDVNGSTQFNEQNQFVTNPLQSPSFVYLGIVYFPPSGLPTGHYIKYNGTGVIQWQKRLASTNLNVYNIALIHQVGNGQVFTCTMEDVGNFPSSTGAILIIQCDNSTTPIWQRAIDGFYVNNIYAASDSSDNIYVAGDLNDASGISIVKYNNSGTFQWKRRFSTNVSVLGYDTVGGLAIKDNALIVTMNISVNATTKRVCLIRYPLDGGITGTYGKYVITSQSNAPLTSSYTFTATATFTDTTTSAGFISASSETLTDTSFEITDFTNIPSSNVNGVFGFSDASNVYDLTVDSFDNMYVTFQEPLASAPRFMKVRKDFALEYIKNFTATAGEDSLIRASYNKVTNKLNLARFKGFDQSIINPVNGVIESVENYTDGADIRFTKYDSAGNIYAFGYTSGSQMVLYKFSSSGSFLWARSLNVINIPEATVDSAGNSYIIFVDNFLRTAVIKFDTDGTILWQRALTVPDIQVQLDVFVDSSFNVYAFFVRSGLNPMFCIKYNSAGTLLLQRELSSSLQTGINVDSAGNMYMCANNTFVKFNSTFTKVWEKNVISAAFNFYPRASALDSSNNYIIAGYDGNTANIGYLYKLSTNGPTNGTYGAFTVSAGTLYSASIPSYTAAGITFTATTITPFGGFTAGSGGSFTTGASTTTLQIIPPS